MSLPAQHHAPSSVAANHMPLSSLAAASQLDLPVCQSAACCHTVLISSVIVIDINRIPTNKLPVSAGAGLTF